MTQFLFIMLSTFTGFFVAMCVHSLLFSLFKADKYEDTLADKIAKRIREGKRE